MTFLERRPVPRVLPWLYIARPRRVMVLQELRLKGEAGFVEITRGGRFWIVALGYVARAQSHYRITVR